MADDEYHKKLDSLQQYIPFLNNMIVQLKDPRKKNREQQLQKMMSLHSMITDKRKKLKLETLIKCEDVILKLYNKVKSGPNNQQQQPTKVDPPHAMHIPSTPMSPITPSSPSPPREILKTQPVVIPTEKVTTSTNITSSSNSYQSSCTSSSSSANYDKPKIDIYSSAADSLKQLEHKTNVFNRLGDHKRLDMSKPPIPIEDLQEALQDSVGASPVMDDTDRMSLNELTDLREKLQKQLSTKSDINTTVRNTMILTKKAVDSATKPKSVGVKSDAAKSNKYLDATVCSKKTEKVEVKSGGDIFGSALSSIDNKIWEESKQSTVRKEERRPSTHTSRKEESSSRGERRSSKDDKRHVDSTKDSASSSGRSSKDNEKSLKLREHLSSTHRDPRTERSTKDRMAKEDLSRYSGDESKPAETHQTYKRLADKYNPKPRKPSFEAPPQVVIEAPAPLLAFKPLANSNPQPSPTSSTNSIDNEVGIKKETSAQVQVTHFTSNSKNPHQQPRNFSIPPVLSQSYQLDEQTATYQPYRSQTPNSMVPQPNQRLPSLMARPYTPFNQIEQSSQQSYPNQFQFHSDSNRGNYGNGNSRGQSRRQDVRDSRRLHNRDRARDPRTPSSTSSSSRDPRHNNRNRNRFNRDMSPRYRDPRLNNDRSRSQSREDETFASPLDSLYGSDGYGGRKTGKGYGVQTFRIPKVKKDGDNGKVEKVEKIEPVETSMNVTSSTTEEGDCKVEAMVDTKPIATTEISSSTSCEQIEVSSSPPPPTPLPTVVPPPTTEIITKNEKESQDIINQFLKDLLQNEQTKAAVSLFIDKVSDSVNDERLKMIVEAVKTAKKDEDEEKQQHQQREEEEEEEEEECKVEPEDSEPEVKTTSNRSNRPKRKKVGTTKPKKVEVPDEEEESDDKVVVSVGERIKKRKRIVPSRKPRAKQKTELDLLHEDIQDMFIRDGVLTATGKRMCRLLKDDSGNTKTRSATLAAITATSGSSGEGTPSLIKTHRRGRSANATPTMSELDKLQVRDIRVMIPKMSVPEMIENASNEDEMRKRPYSLRRPVKEASYTEKDSDNENTRRESSDDSVELEEKEGTTVKPAPAPIVKKTARKRSSAWASGIIVKKKRYSMQKSSDSAGERLLDLIEPDKNYYFNKTWHNKFRCKVCDFHGRNITLHYKIKHPDGEILTSRLSPTRARKAIRDSIDQNLDMAEVHCDNKKMEYKCVFCDKYMLTQPMNFYDHLSTHTGEYRHKCKDCHFSCCNNKSLTRHCLTEHNGTRNAHIVPFNDYCKIFGYMCVECNFVQTNRKTVENHVNIFHLGDGKKVFRIHLTSLPYVAYEENKKITKKVSEDEDLASAEDDDDHQEDEQESDGNDDVSDSPSSTALVPMTPPAKKMKLRDPLELKREQPEIDMNVFTCNTDMHKENEKIELERLQRMTELNETVKTSRQSLNFVDELSNRLMRDYDSSPTSEIFVKDEPLDSDEAQSSSIFVMDKTPPPIINKRSIPLTQAQCQSGAGVVHKDDRVIRGMIQKLRGKLKDDEDSASKDDDGPPPLSLLMNDHFVDDWNNRILRAGFLNLSKDNDGLMFACRVPSCMFTSFDRVSFIDHLNQDHVKVNVTVKLSICTACQREVKAIKDEGFLVTFFSHVVAFHSDFDRNVIVNSTIMRIVKDGDTYIYLCRFASCDYEDDSKENFIKHLESHDCCETYNCPNCDTMVGIFEGSNLLVTYLNHLEKTHMGGMRLGLRTRRLSGDLLSLSKYDDEQPVEDSGADPPLDQNEDIEEKDNPFPFKITNVMSLADEDLPPLSPIPPPAVPSPKVPLPIKKPLHMESVVLKECKLTPREKMVSRKSAQAYKKFMHSFNELYKCPQFFCTFATDLRSMYESHLKSHVGIGVADDMTACVYCDVKTPLTQSGLHIDLRHCGCLFACSQCLYRAICKEYVMVHMKTRHKDKDLIIALKQKPTKTVVMAKQKKWTAKDVCLPYICGQTTCSDEFFYEDQFIGHLQTYHGGVLICGDNRCDFTCLKIDDIMQHWRIHKRFRFNCLLCKFGCSESFSMLEHYSQMHPNQTPDIVDRAKNLRVLARGRDYHNDVFDKLMSEVRVIDKEVLGSINADLFKIIKASDSSLIHGESKTTVNSSPVTGLLLKNNVLAVLPSAGANVKLQLISKSSPPSPPPPSPPALTAPKRMHTPIKDLPETSVKSSPKCSADDAETDVSDESATKNYGLIGYQLFRCAYCDISFSNSRDFKSHCIHSKLCRDSDTQRPYKCVHCQRMFKNPHGILEHVQYHGQLRFSCSLCTFKFPSTFSLKLHMRAKHSVTNTVITPLIGNRTNLDNDEFVLRPKPVDADLTKQDASSHDDDDCKDVYAPEEIDLLPKRHIFTCEVKCSLCLYSTKVRTNMQRHLQFHTAEKSVPAIAPVNPVPCLDKNEKMFDKMTNLAISSFAAAAAASSTSSSTASSGGRMGGGPSVKSSTHSKSELDESHLPAYVPSHRRYACCVHNCNYLCPEEGNLRHHLLALHRTDELRCPHCECPFKSDIDGALKHFKLHDLHLYKCQNCDFLHNLRHKVEKHTTDKHPDKAASVTVVRSLDSEIIDGVSHNDSSTTPSTSSPSTTVADSGVGEPIKSKSWHCGMCKYRCCEKSEVIAHVLYKHDVDKRFKCTLCSYNTDDKDTFPDHFKQTHPDNDIDIIYAFYKNDTYGRKNQDRNCFDTTPLWQRDRPRVRHIRGILFEDTSTSTSTPKTVPIKPKRSNVPSVTSSPSSPPPLAPSSSLPTNLDLAIDAVAKGEDETTSAKLSLKISDDAIFSLLNKEMKDVVGKCDADKDRDDGDCCHDDDDEDREEVGDISVDDLLDVTRIEETSKSVVLNMTAVKITPSTEKLRMYLLESKYGKICAAAGKAYRCPTCHRFRTRKLTNYLHHLLTELGFDRFKCNQCQFRCVSYVSMLKHCEVSHGAQTPSQMTTEIALDESLILWLQMLVQSQSKDLVAFLTDHSIPKPNTNDAPTMLYKAFCHYCNQWVRNSYVLKDHEIYHWADVTYLCVDCKEQFDTINRYLIHCKDIHMGTRPNYKIIGPCVTDIFHILAPAAPTNNSTSVATAPLPSTSTSAIATGGAPSGADYMIDGQTFLCFYCMEAKCSVEELHSHWKESHQGDNVAFRYKEAPPAPGTQFYCCTYCHDKGVYSTLKKHHGEMHAGLKFSVYQLICIECSATFMNSKEIRAHFAKAHSGKRLKYSEIENKETPPDKSFVCIKCPFRSCTTGGIRAHLRKHLRPYDCKLCGSTFVGASEAKLHHMRDHGLESMQIVENKDRMKDYEDWVKKIVALNKLNARKTTEAPQVAKFDTTPAAVIENVAFYAANDNDDDESAPTNTTTPIAVVKDDDDDGDSSP